MEQRQEAVGALACALLAAVTAHWHITMATGEWEWGRGAAGWSGGSVVGGAKLPGQRRITGTRGGTDPGSLCKCHAGYVAHEPKQRQGGDMNETGRC